MDKLTIADIRAADAAAGGFFFSRGAMRFFASRVFPYVYQGAGGVAFVTSERVWREGPPKYTARAWDPDRKQVRTIFPSTLPTVEEARQVARWFAAGTINHGTPAQDVACMLKRANGPLPPYLAAILGE